ncbi:hypothetical protein [Sphingomonas lenta]|uniref:Uncharacterized protein n=1 Tax=Sphingomonas lenta TaxID=1141887 RepID=A0A2A2SFB0_9SPHN|nr:hypothetical protein [Sphingomonas lenta]PAX07882.1 hypothetical protein CKY28_09730 [Sphingomonas lenta]
MSPSEIQQARSQALSEAERMLSATQDRDPESQVALTIEHFRRIAELLATLAREPAPDDDEFDAPLDGVRFWVPLPEIEAVRAELAALRGEYDRLISEQQLERFAF